MVLIPYKFRLFFLFLLILIYVLIGIPASAQYKVFVWDNFDDGKFPGTLEFAYQSSAKTVSVYDYQLPGSAFLLHDQRAPLECGRYGLKIQTTSSARFQSVVDSLVLDRDLLGEKGRALYQADLYLPEDVSSQPSMDVVAVDHRIEDASKSWKFYRLGMKKTAIYFSYTNGDVKKGGPILYYQQKISDFKLKRPGWHRIQLIFEGREGIICAVDGRPTKFSPFNEGTLRNLRAGIMAISPEDSPGECIVDNLSVQWTPEEIAMPNSPWGAEHGKSPSLRLSGSQGSGAPLKWSDSPAEAWNKSQEQKQPILILFYTPQLEGYHYITRQMEKDPKAKDLLKRFVLLSVDVNQLRGGRFVESFNIFKVPTFLVMGVDGKEKTRAIVSSATTWSDVAAQIQKVF